MQEAIAHPPASAARAGGESPRAVHPDRVEYGGREVVIGPKGYALLVHVQACGGSAPLLALGPAVYGADEVNRNRIEVQCHRVNKRLEELGCPARLGVDQGRVVLA